jgi:mono/diheme cytochrome c family protein
MKTTYLSLACLSLLVMSCDSPKKEEAKIKLYEAKTEKKMDPIKRGELLVNAIGCHDCHSPKKMTDKGPVLDPEKILSGHPAGEVLAPYDKETAKAYVLFNMSLTAAIGPWGTSYASNLTTDDTGIGTWTEQQFMTAIKKGKFKGQEGGRDLLPPMPWPSYSQLPDDDLKAIFAYLKTVKPVENVVPAPLPPGM